MVGCDAYEAPNQDCMTAGPQVVAAEGLCGPCAVRLTAEWAEWCERAHLAVARAERAEERLEAVASLTEGPTGDGYRPYAVSLDDDVHLAVLLDDLRAALDSTR